MDRRRTGLLVLCLLPVALLLASSGPTSAREEALRPPIRHFWEDWFRAAEPWMTEDEHEAFERLGSDSGRERFLRAFWETRGERELRRWTEARREALRRFEDPGDPRVLAWTLAGPPSDRFLSDCRGGFGPLEVWHWTARRLAANLDREVSEDLVVLLYRDRLPFSSEIVWWSPDDGVGVLAEPVLPKATPEDVATRARRHRCFPSRRAEASFERALTEGSGAASALERLAERPVGPDRVRSPTPAETVDRELSATVLEVVFPGRYQTRTILEGRFRIPADVLEHSASGRIFDTVRAIGEVRRDGRLLDAFRLTWWIVGDPPRDGTVEVRFVRRVAPGPVRLEARLEDGLGRGLWRSGRDLEVPRLLEEASPPPGTRRGFGRLARPEVATLVTLPTVDLLPLPPPPHVGILDVAAATSGGPIDRIRFSVDGVPAAVDAEAPWSARIDLGPEPADRTLEAAALDREGRILDRATAPLLAAPESLTIRLDRGPGADPESSGPTAAGGVEVTLHVDGPSETPWTRAHLELDGRTLAEWTNESGEPRARRAVSLPPISAPTAVLQARVVDSSGDRAEAVLVVGRAPTERVDVRLVELETTVVDGAGHPVLGLPREVFRVFEDGREVPLVDFLRVADRPLDLALLVDLSSSMRPRLVGLERAARDFVRSVLEPGDRASLVTFDHEIRRRARFTDRAAELTSILDHLWARGSTRLHDALWFALASFDVPERRRALILLSDGQDVDSDLDLAAVHDEALRSGVTVYAILLDLEHDETRQGLEELAAATGGRAYTVDDPSRLGAIYRRIEEELRSRYLLVVESSPGAPGLRRVRVDVGVDGLSARSRTAYLP